MTNKAADTRRLAIDALVRIDADGAYANIVLPHMLQRSRLDSRDRAFATELVYGTTRMRRACDWLVDRYLIAPVEPVVRAALRLGAYQLVFVEVPAHAAVNTTVSASPARARRLVNAVLRKVSAETDRAWPDDATRLSYPEWIVERLRADLGTTDADDALAAMNVGAPSTVRADGYVQDESSQLVGAAVDAAPDERIADTCAAPGGKATALAASGALVVASDLRASRVSLIAANREQLDAHSLLVSVADGTRLPYRDASFDRVLVDAPCSGLGALRHRPDARWRIDEAAPDRLAALQFDLLREAERIVAPGGVVLYSVCTLTDAETVAVDARVERELPSLVPASLPAPWEERGRGGQILPQLLGTDGMFAVRYDKR
ncbi:MAG TPA: transcription antitermination factor NusB [Acidimicrobiales bacterium]|nr:transcription antitermination factor NusB [Acidimicrobiales bacterium]